MIERRKFPDRGSIASQLIGVNDLWNVIFTQESDQEGLCGLCVTVPLKENIEHKAMLVYSLPAGRRAHARPFCLRHSK